MTGEWNSRLPAGLELHGREEELTRGPQAHPSGARADRRHSVPGTSIPDGPSPAAASGEVERIRQAVEATGRPSAAP